MLSILLFLRYHSPHPTFGIGHIALVSRNEVHMAMEDALTGILANVDAYIISVWMITLVNLLANILKHHVHRFAFVIGQVEI